MQKSYRIEIDKIRADTSTKQNCWHTISIWKGNFLKRDVMSEYAIVELNTLFMRNFLKYDDKEV